MSDKLSLNLLPQASSPKKTAQHLNPCNFICLAFYSWSQLNMDKATAFPGSPLPSKKICRLIELFGFALGYAWRHSMTSSLILHTPISHLPVSKERRAFKFGYHPWNFIHIQPPFYSSIHQVLSSLLMTPLK